MDNNQNAVTIFNKHANLYAGKYMDVSDYSSGINYFCDQVKPMQAKVLEIACGPGNITKYLLNRRPDLQILGIDLAANMLALAKENNPSANFEQFDCRNIHQIQQRFDAVLIGFCLPYLSFVESKKMIADAASLLHPGGIIYISTIEGNYVSSEWRTGSTGDTVFMHYYNETDLRVMLTAAHFEVLQVQRKKDLNELQQIVNVDIILIAQLSHKA
jgi:2-polyprenyl-3-methyl-5-hydroxy-6-metoxy-1,4-benzoquinol methylase